jgi:hypothetical protein
LTQLRDFSTPCITALFALFASSPIPSHFLSPARGPTVTVFIHFALDQEALRLPVLAGGQRSA